MDTTCVFDKGKRCSALTKKDCIGCHFRKTREEYEQGQKEARDRIEGLPDDERVYIDRTYYNAINRKALER